MSASLTFSDGSGSYSLAPASLACSDVVAASNSPPLYSSSWTSTGCSRNGTALAGSDALQAGDWLVMSNQWGPGHLAVTAASGDASSGGNASGSVSVASGSGTLAITVSLQPVTVTIAQPDFSSSTVQADMTVWAAVLALLALVWGAKQALNLLRTGRNE